MKTLKAVRVSRKVVRGIAFDPDVLHEVDQQAQACGTNRSSFINRLLFAYLLGRGEIHEIQQEQRRTDGWGARPCGANLSNTKERD